MGGMPLFGAGAGSPAPATAQSNAATDPATTAPYALGDPMGYQGGTGGATPDTSGAQSGPQVSQAQAPTGSQGQIGNPMGDMGGTGGAPGLANISLQDIANALSPQGQQQPQGWFPTPGVDPTSSTGLPKGTGTGWQQTPGVNPQTSTGLPEGAAGNVVGQQQQAPVGQAPVQPPAPAPAPTPAPPPATEAETRAIGRQRRDEAAAGAAPSPPAGGQGGPQPQQGFNPLQAIFDLLFGGPQKFMQDLQGLNQQAGPAYGPQNQYNTQGGARGYGYGDTQPPAGQPPQAAQASEDPNARVTARPGQLLPRTTMEQARRDRLAGGEDMPPGSAAAAVKAGFDRAAAQEGRQPAPAQQATATPGQPAFPGAAPGEVPPRPPGGIPHNVFQARGIQPSPDMVTTINTPYGPVTANKQAVNDVQGLMGDLKNQGAPISKFGSYNRRKMRRGNAWSSHAYGVAFDIDDKADAMTPQMQRWVQQNPQRWQNTLARWNFSQPYPGWDPNHLEWGGPRQGGSVAALPSERPGTRGDRNNNPGNVKTTNAPGQVGRDNQGHAIFGSPQAGLAAQADVLRQHYRGQSIEQIGRRYAKDPGWAAGVMRAGGYRPGEVPDMDTPQGMERLQRAISKQEGTRYPGPAAPTAAPTIAPGNLGQLDPGLMQLASNVMVPRLKSAEQRRIELERAEGGGEQRRGSSRPGYERIYDPGRQGIGGRDEDFIYPSGGRRGAIAPGTQVAENTPDPRQMTPQQYRDWLRQHYRPAGMPPEEIPEGPIHDFDPRWGQVVVRG